MDELKKLYDVLYRERKYTKSFEEFQSKWSQDELYRNKVFEVVYRDGLYTKDKTSFFQKYSGGTPTPAPAPAPAPEQEPVTPIVQVQPKKKSEFITELPSVGGGLAQQDSKQTAPTSTLSGPQKQIPMAAESSSTPKPIVTLGKKEVPTGQGWVFNAISALDRGIAKNVVGNPIKGLGTLLQGATAKVTGGTGEGFVSDALIRFGNYFNDAIDEITPIDEDFKGTLSDQFSEAFGQVLGLAFTGGAGLTSKGAGLAATAGAVGKGGAVTQAAKTLASELTSPVSISAGLSMGQSEFERAKELGATDEEAFEAFYKNAAVGSILEKIPIMQFMKRFNKSSSGGLTNYLKTKGVGGLTGGIEEMTTEVIQQLYANKTAQEIYNTNQDLFEGVGESGGVGFGVGFLLNAMGANAKLLRSQGRDAEANVVESQIDLFESKASGIVPPVYKVNGIKIESPDVISNMIDNMGSADLAKSNIEISNDPVLEKKLQDKIVTSSIKEQVRLGNPELNEPSLNAITELEKELRKLEGNTTQTAKDKSAALRKKIKDIQENQLQEEVSVTTAVAETPEATQQRVDRIAELEDLLNPDSPSLFPIEREEELRTELQTLKTEQDAIQKQAAGQVPVQPTAGVSETLAEGEPQAEPQVVTQEGVQEEVVLNTINPTGTIFSEYKPEQIDALPLGENITTYDVTANLNPTEKITVYRGVPNDVNEIKSGDFVTTNKQLAQDYAGTGKVISMEVNANEILDDKTEPLGEEYILRIPQPEVSSKTQEEATQGKVDADVKDAPKLVRDISVLITPATVRAASPLTKRIKSLSLKYDKLVKAFSKKKDKKTLEQLREAEVQILNDAKQEIIDEVSKVKGVSVSFGPDRRGLWDGAFEPSLNMVLSISPQADTESVSKLLFDFAEKYSQDAFILESDSNYEQDVINGNRGVPLTEFDENGLMHYPQIIYTFAEPITDEEVADISVNLQNNGVDAFSINNNEVKVSVIKFFPENSTLNETEQYEERRKDFDAKSEATVESTVNVLGGAKQGSVDVRIKKSSYQGARNEKSKDQTREYDRSDVLKPFKETVTNVEAKSVELASIRKKQIKLQEEGKQLSKEEQDRFDELNKEVQPVVQKTFEVNKRLYEEAKSEVESIAQKAIKGLKASLSPFPIKRPERASVKTIRWYNAFTEKLGDGARVNIVVENDADANKVFDLINKQYPVAYGDTDLRRVTEKTELGYPKRLIELRTSNGIIAEIQVITNEAYLAKDGLSGFTGDQKQKESAKNKLSKIRENLGWAIPDGLGHYFYEIQRDINVDENLRNEAIRLSNLYYEAFTNPKSTLPESFMNDVVSFKKKVDEADKSSWDKGNEGKTPAPLTDYINQVSLMTQQEIEPEEEFVSIEAKDVKIPAFSKYNASDYVEDEREGDNGRSYTYMSSITVEATNADGDNIGSITKIVDEDGNLSFTAEDVDGNEVGRGEIYDTLAEAKAALAIADNKIRKKEFAKEQKAKAKEKEKAAAKAEKEKAKQKAKAEKVAAKAVPAPVPAPTTAPEAEVEAEVVQGALDEMLDLDPAQKSTGKKIVDGLDKLIKDIENFEKGTLGVNIALPVMKVILKSIKALVQAGMTLQEAIKKAAKDNSVSVRDVTNGINAISQILPIQKEYDALMTKADALITRQKSRGIDDKKIVSNLDAMIRNSEVYKNANDAQRKIMEREARVKMGVGPRKAASIGRVIGVLKDITNVSRAEKLQIISRIRELSRDVAKDLAAEIRDLAGEGKITARQAANIISKFGKVNMLSEISVSKFVDYMTKVFADAEYASKLSRANSTKKSLSSLSKNKDKNANLRDLAQQFVKIDPSMVEDIDAYNEMASKILESIKGSTIKGQKVSFAEIANIENATDYINETLKAQQEAMLAERAAEIQSLMGIDVSDFSYDDMMMLLDSKKPISKYNEGIIRDTINKAFSVFSSIIKDAIRTGKDPFTGEDISFTESQKDVVERFMEMDLNILKPKEALEAVDALANFLQNKSTAKMEAVVSKYTGLKNAKELSKKGIRSFQLKKYGMPILGRVLGEQTTNLNVLFERMFKGFNRAGQVMDKMGLTKLINKKALAQKQANNIVNAYVDKFYKLKANGEAFNSAYNNIERGVAAFMMRNVVGTEQEMQSEFERRKNLIEESIDVLSKGNDKEKAKAKLYQEVYDKMLIGDAKNIGDIRSKTDKTNLEAVDFWMNEWANKFEQLSDVAENVYNKVLDKDINYTPDRFYNLSSDTGVIEIGNDDSAFLINGGGNDLYQRETGVLMQAVRPKTLPVNEESGKVNRYIDLSFDNNNSNSMYDALVDINTASAIRQIEAFLNSPDFENIFPNSDDAKIIKGNRSRIGRIDLYIRNIRNKNPYSNDELSSIVRKLNKLAAIGVGQALGGITQPIKQVIPVAINTIVNGGGLDISAVFNQDKNAFIDNSGYAIASRGLESQAQIESLNKLIEEVSETKGEKLMAGIEKLNKWWLDKFLVKPDVFIARAAWLTYYEQSLKKQGIDTKDIDYSTHKLNEDAANYAQRMVDRQQNVSDADLAGKFFANRESSNQLLVKTLMPFASFRMNQSSRLGADLATLTNKTSTKEDKKVALRSVAGFAAEMATFRTISVGISVLLGTLAKSIMGVDEDDEEKEKRVDNIIKGAKTGVFTDVFSPLPIADKFIQKGGAMLTEAIEDATELPVAIYSPRKEEFLTNAGLFGIALERASQLRELSNLSVTGKYTDDFGKEKKISPEAQEGLSFLIPAAILSNVGLAPSEVNTVVRYAIKDSKKKTVSQEDKQEKAERKEEREQSKQQKLDAFENIKQKVSDPEVLNAIDEKIKELNATEEEKKERKEENEMNNKAERKLKKSLLTDPDTGEEYDTETEMKRYNKDLWEKNFGEGSDWYKSHKAKDKATELLNKEIRRMEDEEYNYTPKKKGGFGSSSFGTNEKKSKKKSGFGSSKFGAD